MSDITLVLWLRAHQFKTNAVYWLRVIGYDAQNPSLMNRLYTVYFMIFALAWVALMWIFAVGQAVQFGKLLPNDGRVVFLTWLPWAIVLVQAFLMYRALKSTPLKLSFPDSAYLAGSPTSRSAPAVVDYFKTILFWLLPIVPVSALIAVLLDVPLGTAVVNLSGAPAALVAIPLTALSFALAWALGMARMARVPILRSSFSWILPAIWIIAAYYIPDVVLWPGRVLVNGIDGQTSALALAILAVLALVVIVVMGWVSRRADMIKASDESVLYARLNQLGTMAWTQRDLRGKIKSEVSLASRGAWLTLPSGNGSLAIAGRAWLAFVRHPMQLVLAVVSGAVFVYSGAWLIVEHSPVQLWLVWLFVLVIVPPRGLVHQYRIDLREAFLRQMLPFSNLRLLMAGAALPGAIVIVTGWLVMAIAPGVIPLSSPDLLPLFAVVAILIVIMETLSLGLDAIKIAGIGVHISQMWTSFFGFGIILLVNMLAGDSTLAILTTVIIALFVAMPLAASYSSQE